MSSSFNPLTLFFDAVISDCRMMKKVKLFEVTSLDSVKEAADERRWF